MRILALIPILASLVACGGASNDPAVGNPIVIHDAQLRDGPLPGIRDAADGGADDLPKVEAVTIIGLDPVRFGMTDRTINGSASGGAVAIGIGFAGYDDAHWIIPVGAPDAVFIGQNKFTAKIDFGTNIPTGHQRVEVVAIDADGNAGRIGGFGVCVFPDVPDNGATCDPAAAIPDTVVSLVWSTNVDLDLIAVTPDGKIVSMKTPNTTSTVDGGFGLTPAQLADPSNGRLTRDSNKDCVIDSVRRESIVWNGPPVPGTYRVYARLSRACDQLSTEYVLETYRSDGTSLLRTDRRSGQFLALQASGNVGLGTLVAEIPFP